MDVTREVETQPIDALVKELKATAKQGLYKTAYLKAIDSWGPLQNWHTPKQLSLATHLLSRLGADRLADSLCLKLWRRFPHNNDAAIKYAIYLQNSKGPLATFRFIEDHEPLAGDNTKDRAEWLVMRALVAIRFRDFETAESLAEQAIEMTPDDVWVISLPGYILMSQQEFERAAEFYRALYLSHPVESVLNQWANATTAASSKSDAIALLEQHIERFESASLWSHLASLYLNNHQWSEGEAALAKIQQYRIGHDKSLEQYLEGQYARLALEFGDYDKAKVHLSLCRGSYHKSLLKQLNSSDDHQNKVQLNVPFIRQEYLTCAPTTLAALLRYWGMDYSPKQIADQICYDGTPEHLQRKWLNEHAIPHRSFAMTWESAVTLLDAGFPFALVTHDSTSSHMQAVIGYNATTRVLYLMDPSSSSEVEMLADPGIEQMKYNGPRAMALAPADKAEQLAKFELAEAEIYALYNPFVDALEQGDLTAAESRLAVLESAHSDHRLTLLAQRSLAHQQVDHRTMLVKTQALLDRYPEESSLARSAFHSMLNLGDTEEALNFGRNQLALRKDPSFLLMLTQQLHSMKKYEAEVAKYTQQLQQYCWHLGEALWSLGHWHWAKQEFEQALNAYRWSATLEDTSETSAISYFKALRCQKREQEGLEFLKKRYQRLGAKAAGPAITLFEAHELMGHEHKGLTLLEDAIELRPNDSQLQAFYLGQLIQAGNIEQFEKAFSEQHQHLDEITAKHLQTKALRYQGKFNELLPLYRELHKVRPLSREFGDNYCQLMAQREDRNTLDQELEQQLANAPTQWTPLWLVADWHTNSDRQIEALKSLLARNEDSEQVHSQLVRTLIKQQALDQALAHARNFVAQMPQISLAHAVLAEALLANSETQQAKQSALEALAINVDNDDAIYTLMRTCANMEERTDVLERVIALLDTQSVFGDALWNISYWAQNALSDERLGELHRLWLHRYPDCWEAWSSAATYHRDRNDLSTSLDLLNKARLRFPLVPKVHYDFAETAFYLGQSKLAVDALNEALAQNPHWTSAYKKLSEIYESQGDLVQATEVLKRALVYQPDDGILYGLLADMQWREGNKEIREEALGNLGKALERTMDYPWAWEQLTTWGNELNKPNLASELAHRFVEENDSAPITWLNLARFGELGNKQQVEANIRKALSLNPEYSSAQSALLDLMLDQYRYAEVLSTCDEWTGKNALNVNVKFKRVEAFWRTGQGKQAIAEAQSILSDSPNYSTGWRRLASMARRMNNKVIALDAANQLAKSNPHDASDLTFAADVFSEFRPSDPKVGDWLAKAFSIQPQESYVSLNWLDHLLEQNAYEQAQEVEQVIAKFEDDPWLWTRQIKRFCATEQTEQALARWEEVLRSGEDTGWLYQTGLQALTNTSVSKQAIMQLEAAISDNQAAPVAANIWAKRQHPRKNRVNLFKMFDKLHGPVWDALVEGYFERLEENHQLPHPTFLEQHQAKMKASVRLTGSYAYLLQMNGHFYDAIDWYKHLPTGKPEQVPGYIWYQYQWALRYLNRWTDAKRINLLAVENEPDNCYDSALLWRALDLLMAGQEQGQNVLSNLNQDYITTTEQHLYQWCHLYGAILDAPLDTQFEQLLPLMKEVRKRRKQDPNCQFIARVRRHFIAAASSNLASGGLLKQLWIRLRLSMKL
ncbi:C39 family peptidase [Corallincola platygyrae]|uniref:C39 family peptidase n=1 Tax=Corallincola platygyrae TaxID=1193278 RepID=A0ABW4XRT3_9GAMM